MTIPPVAPPVVFSEDGLGDSGIIERLKVGDAAVSSTEVLGDAALCRPADCDSRVGDRTFGDVATGAVDDCGRACDPARVGCCCCCCCCCCCAEGDTGEDARMTITGDARGDETSDGWPTP